MSTTRTSLLAPAGFVVGGVFWVLNTELGQILPYSTCGSPVRIPALVAFSASLGSLAGSWLSWRAARSDTRPFADSSAYPTSFAFVGKAAALAGIVIAFGLFLQGIAALVLSGCER